VEALKTFLINFTKGVEMEKKKRLSLEEALFLTFKESGYIAFQSIDEMHNILKNEAEKSKK